MPENAFEELHHWIRRSGTLIAVASAAQYVQRSLIKLKIASEEGQTRTAPMKLETDPRFVDARSTAALNLVCGAILKTQIDQTHPWLWNGNLVLTADDPSILRIPAATSHVFLNAIFLARFRDPRRTLVELTVPGDCCHRRKFIEFI